MKSPCFILKYCWIIFYWRFFFATNCWWHWQYIFLSLTYSRIILRLYSEFQFLQFDTSMYCRFGGETFARTFGCAVCPLEGRLGSLLCLCRSSDYVLLGALLDRPGPCPAVWYCSCEVDWRHWRIQGGANWAKIDLGWAKIRVCPHPKLTVFNMVGIYPDEG